MKSIIVSSLLLGAAIGGDLWKESKFDDFYTVAHKTAFDDWKAAFDVSYRTAEEEAERYLIFLDNWYKIVKENEKDHSYTLGLNQFGDLTGDEFRMRVHGHLGSCLNQKEKWHNPARYRNERAVEAKCSSVDWVAKNKVTPVKDQGQCGSCWAFSAVGCLESRYAIQNGQLNSLSEQELVDCSGSQGNAGCNGGWMDSAFTYIKGAGGLALESDYKYTAADGTCESSKYTHYDPITGYTDVTADSSTSMADAVCDGPVSVAIQADQFAFQFYTSGILDGRCGTSLDHGVLVVGFGTDGGESYWKVKNSWGSSWGESGYVRICKDCSKNNGAGECGILESPSYVST